MIEMISSMVPADMAAHAPALLIVAPMLLAPVAASASHVGFCALRLEPIWMSLGEAAGYAAHTALDDKVAEKYTYDISHVELAHRHHT